MSLEKDLKGAFVEAFSTLFKQEIDEKAIQLQQTRKEFEGDLTIVIFPYLRFTKKSPEESGKMLGNKLLEMDTPVSGFNVVKGFLNLTISPSYWLSKYREFVGRQDWQVPQPKEDAEIILVEYSSPNTNKPLHLGHIRNNLLGYSVAQILKAAGKQVYKTNIVNDRGIHICKSMLAWQKWGNGATPESTNKKGDHLVGDYYVKFDQEYKKQVADLIEKDTDPKKAEKMAPLLLEAQEMLLKWEQGDPEVRQIWQMMNDWVYAGFDATYKKMGVDFDKIYYESETFKLGKQIVLQGLDKKVLQKQDDGSVWIDLTDDGLDKKILLRSDGTAVYMTQDLGTAVLRQQDFNFDQHIYVVGNEQDYHFKVLSIVLDKLGYPWAKQLYHLSYGMVELPEGKMKSREGTVVDADDLIETMIETAQETSRELGKLEEFSKDEAANIHRIIALGALKYFILRVDPKKNMTFNPKESIDFKGNTGPFIQYTYTRIQSVLRKAAENQLSWNDVELSGELLNNKEIGLIKLLAEYKNVVADAAEKNSPATIANYAYELAKEYNQFYYDYQIIAEEVVQLKKFRLQLSEKTGETIKAALDLLGIEVPERM